MGFWSKLVILALAALAFFYVKVNFFDTPHAKVEKKLVAEEQVVEPVKKQPAEEAKKPQQTPKEKTYVTVYFLGMDKNDTGIFKKVKRELPDGQSKLKFALNQLVAGPSQYEKSIGVYSEIPKDVKILGIVERSFNTIFDKSLWQMPGLKAIVSRVMNWSIDNPASKLFRI